jgi:hypothetical protein
MAGPLAKPGPGSPEPDRTVLAGSAPRWLAMLPISPAGYVPGMRHHHLGQLDVPALGLGCMGMSEF